ncbi:phosphocarrier protein FPr [Rhizomicrobium palustre]|uniref:Multiphosphoryl transfer protein n=1 Tax=Rhizomicrobium palustre TaxID=189966 RepID=A0A846N2K2_9PROT|nr:phosphoenolpyruvate--protein phosphotransferase [Rhizomicrobium palustre]NIK89531.1 phosphocarrier protein FPr [Rhizomicrobium palustre]
MSATSVAGLLSPKLIQLAARPASKAEAIEQAAALLVAAGIVASGYGASMQKREAVANTFLGHGIAIPHCLAEDRNLVLKSGLAILQVPAGVIWNDDQEAKLIVAIAAQSDTHLSVLRRLTRLLQDEAALAKLFATEKADDILAAFLADEAQTQSAPASDFAVSAVWTVTYPAGLHARPATRWVETAKGFASSIKVRRGAEAGDAKSLVALLQLGVKPGEEVVFSAEGRDAEAAVAALKVAAESLAAQEIADAKRAAEKSAAKLPGWTPPGNPIAISGVAAAPGLAIGRLHILRGASEAVPDHPVPLTEGGSMIDAALTATRSRLKALADDTTRRLGASEAAIFKAQAELLNDTDLITRACQLMVEGHGPAWSWNAAVEDIASKLASLNNPVLAGRAADLRDVGRQVLLVLEPGLARSELCHDVPPTLEEKCILVAKDLSPSDTAALDSAIVAGIVTAEGGPTSHTAILARTLGIPALVAAGAGVLGLTDGAPAIIEGQGGRLYLDPSAEDLVAAREHLAALAAKKAQEAERRALPAVTTDGKRTEIVANINQAHQAAFAIEQGAEGVGLMRTEFLFLETRKTPDEDEQYEAYAAMLKAMDGRQVIVRALDIGGDKQVPHLALPQEANPFLGVRGARLLLRRPELLLPQLRALYRAASSAAGKLAIMFPMITSAAEIIRLRSICEDIRKEVNAPEVPLGIMIEVPAAALQAHVLAQHVDFFSVGTNDLTQYTLAMDRQNPDLAPEADSLHPAVLRLIGFTVDGAKRYGRMVGVCGGLAGDPFGASLLAGLGVDELSMTPLEIPAVKDRLRRASLAELKGLAARALACESAADVRALEGVAP